MAEDTISVALIAGQVDRRGEARALARLVGRLAGHRVTPRVVCAGGAAELRQLGVESWENPWLRHPWLRRLAGRYVPLEDTHPRPVLVHALHDDVAEAAASISLRWQVPLILSVGDYPAEGYPLKRPLPEPAAVVAGDAELARFLQDQDHLPPERHQVIPPGVEIPDLPAPSWPPCARVPVIGAMGSPCPRSGATLGFETFLDAIHRVLDAGRDVEFLLAGLGADEARIRRRADRLEVTDRLTFAPPATTDSAFWGVIDLYCQPAHEATTARPLIAAMVAGLPCVASDVPGPRTLLDSGSRGLLVPPDDPAALARALLTLLDQPDLARALSEAARPWAIAHFDPDLEADALADLYARIASPAPSP